jgi:hypothetical protein
LIRIKFFLGAAVRPRRAPGARIRRDLTQVKDSGASAASNFESTKLCALSLDLAGLGNGRATMSESHASGESTAPHGTGQPSGKVPFMQRLLDNPFLLLFLGVVIPTVFYLIWGILEVAQVPIAR